MARPSETRSSISEQVALWRQILFQTRILRDSGAIVGLCHGCFDVLHFGHVAHLEEARSIVDILVVSLTADEFVNKPGRPIFTLEKRMKVLAALRSVDIVVGSYSLDAMRIIEQLHPNFYFKGSDYTGPVENRVCQHEKFQQERHFIESFGGKVHFTNAEFFSSTQVISLMRESC